MTELAVTCGLLAAVVLVLAATIVWQNERQYRERREIAQQIDRLLQRIQAPQAAVAQHYNESTPPVAPPAVNEFDDDDYWAKVNDMSREELADLEAEHEVTGG